MHIKLVHTVLIEPHIFLLDEPTKHLSRPAVQWITGCLCELDHQTVLTVLHWKASECQHKSSWNWNTSTLATLELSKVT